LKTRFARPRHFYENLKERHLHKMRTIDARPRGAGTRGQSYRDVATATARWPHVEPVGRQGRRDAAVVNAAFTMQRIVHHATGRSPFRTNGCGGARDFRASARQNTAVRPALAFA
jgi:hypothetical protein